MSKRKPHSNFAGYITERKHPFGGHSIILNAKRACIGAPEKYVVVLEHPSGGFIGPSFTSEKKAREWWVSDIQEPNYNWFGGES